MLFTTAQTQLSVLFIAIALTWCFYADYISTFIPLYIAVYLWFVSDASVNELFGGGTFSQFISQYRIGLVLVSICIAGYLWYTSGAKRSVKLRPSSTPPTPIGQLTPITPLPLPAADESLTPGGPFKEFSFEDSN